LFKIRPKATSKADAAAIFYSPKIGCRTAFIQETFPARDSYNWLRKQQELGWKA